MRLFYIDKPYCRHITEIMPGIKAVYQMEQEFFPYLLVDFIPNKDNKPEGIVLQAGNEVIRKNMSFNKKSDIDTLRKLIWKYLRKYHNPRDIADEKGCIKNFKKTMTFNVTQGWQAKKRNLRADVCCKWIRDTVANDITHYLIQHWSYRDPTNNEMDRNICKKIRFKECGDNYPHGTSTHKKCIDDANWLCNADCPKSDPSSNKKVYCDKSVSIADKNIDELKLKIYKYAKDNNIKLNRKQVDQIISAGLFYQVMNRMSNFSINFLNVSQTLDSIMKENKYYDKMIEGFDEDEEGVEKIKSYV
jgi:hypothetical protein